jgi:hypothetical protein
LHAKDAFILETLAHGTPPPPAMLPRLLDNTTFAVMYTSLRNKRAPGPDRLPNEIIKLMPPSYMHCLHKLFVLMWLTATTPDSWKSSITKLLYKKGDMMLLSNYRPIGLNNSLYKLWTRFLTHHLSNFADQYSILSMSQEGFRKQHNTIRHMQRLTFAVEDARHFHQDLYVMYLDLTSAFNTVDHAKLCRIMADLGFPLDAVDIIANLYHNATSVVQVGAFGVTRPVPVRRGTIQGDTLSPFLFLLFLEPLLRWLMVGQHGYTFHAVSDADMHRTNLAASAFADDLSLLARTQKDLEHQFDKVIAYCLWANLLINAAKCAVSALLHHSHSVGHASSPWDNKLLTQQLSNRFWTEQNGIRASIPFLPPDKPYPYLGCQFTLTLNWKPHFQLLTQTLLEKAHSLVGSNVPSRQALHIIKTVLKPKLMYVFGIAPFSARDLHQLDNMLIRVTKICMGLPTNFPNRAVLQSTLQDGVGLTSLFHDYTSFNFQYMVRALNDDGDLGIISRAALTDNLRRCGMLPFANSLSHHTDLSRHCMCIRQLTLLHHSPLRLKFRDQVIDLVGNTMWQRLTRLPTLAALPSHIMYPLWDLGIFDLAHLLEETSPPRVYDTLAFCTRFTNARASHKLALNRLTLLLHGRSLPEALTHTSYTPLSAALRLVSAAHNLVDLPTIPPPSVLPSPNSARQVRARRAMLSRQGEVYAFPSEPAPPLPGYRDAFSPHTASSATLLTDTNLQRQGVWGSPVAARQNEMTQQRNATAVSVSVTPSNPDVDIAPSKAFCIQLGLRAPTALQPHPATLGTAYVYKPNGTLHGHSFLAFF